MPREHRVHVPGSIYHVILRGNNRLPLFFDRDERELLEGLVNQCRSVSMPGARVLLDDEPRAPEVQVSEVPLGRFVQLIASGYARRHNRRYARRSCVRVATPGDSHHP